MLCFTRIRRSSDEFLWLISLLFSAIKKGRVNSSSRYSNEWKHWRDTRQREWGILTDTTKLKENWREVIPQNQTTNEREEPDSDFKIHLQQAHSQAKPLNNKNQLDIREGAELENEMALNQAIPDKMRIQAMKMRTRTIFTYLAAGLTGLTLRLLVPTIKDESKKRI